MNLSTATAREMIARHWPEETPVRDPLARYVVPVRYAAGAAPAPDEPPPAEWTAETERACADPDCDEPLSPEEEACADRHYSARPGPVPALLLGACILLFLGSLALMGVWGLIERLRP